MDDKPDKQYEYFWITFKNAMCKYINNKLKDNFTEISSILNNLQKEQKYDIIFENISEFMNTNIK